MSKPYMIGQNLDDYSEAQKYEDGFGIFIRGNNVAWRTKYKGKYYGDFSEWENPDADEAYTLYKKKFEETKKKIDENDKLYENI